MPYEFVVVVIAAILAGIGTGLVGLSAATIMIPLLIVLCPSFQSEHGVYMAGAIALASDILGSAVASTVYAKNKNIDLKHGWILLTCVLVMCLIGSILAFFVQQNVLGTFSLSLCILVGLKFIIKPETASIGVEFEDNKLSTKQIVCSIIFGSVIGFVTGFFGSGGGMIMLIVLTWFIGYNRKNAVGTSTFIMTFTALIGSVSHIIMEPDIIKDCWSFLVIAMICATIASIGSSQFANKVKPKTSGLITGIILFGVGIALFLLNYI